MLIVKKLLEFLTKSKVQIVYVRDEYHDCSQEYSRDTRSSSYYHYTKPKLIITNDNRTIPADDIIKSTKNDKAIGGIIGEYRDSYPEQGVRNREYILHISEVACPLKVKYSSGSGESHKNSDFWSSESKEYWVIYLRERTKY